MLSEQEPRSTRHEEGMNAGITQGERPGGSLTEVEWFLSMLPAGACTSGSSDIMRDLRGRGPSPELPAQPIDEPMMIRARASPRGWHARRSLAWGAPCPSRRDTRGVGIRNNSLGQNAKIRCDVNHPEEKSSRE